MTASISAVMTLDTDPASLDSGAVPATAVFLVRCRPSGLSDDTTGDADPVAVGEIVCRGKLAHWALDHLRAGDAVQVRGALGLRPAPGLAQDSPVVLLTIRATELAHARPTTR